MPKRRLTRAQRKRHGEAAGWLLRNGDVEQPQAERSAFEEWLARDPENRHAYDAAKRLMGEARIAIESDATLRDHEAKPGGVGKRVVGMSLALAVAGGLFVLGDGTMRLQADVISGAGEMPVVTLEDGSVVQMNASSAVAYDFSGQRRTVRLLRGQAFFQVASDPRRPFTVDAGATRVTALGTAFDVRRGEGETDVTVTHNAVLVEFADKRLASVRVGEGEQAVYDHARGANEVRTRDAAAALAWTRGQLVVDNQPVSYVVGEMNRHFSGRIVVASDALAGRRVSGTMAIADVEAALSFLERALGVRTTRLGPLILIRN